MSQSERKTLSLPKKSDQDAGIEFILDVVDVLLPCRQFSVRYRVAELGSVSLISEFVLRLIRTAEEIEEQLIATFFGFSERELAFALAELHAHDYVTRFNGRVTLTESGLALFKEHKRVPQIFEVQERATRQGFDLLSLAPQDIQGLSAFERRLDELRLRDMAKVANASIGVRDSFRRFFGEISARTDRELSKQLSLYSIDEVVAERRFSAVVPVVLKGSSLRPGLPEIDLTAWRQPQELDDRSQVMDSVMAYIDSLEVSASADDHQAYSVLLEIGSEFLHEFRIRDGLSVERYFKDSITKAGDIRIDRQTIPLVGSIFTPGNNSKLFEALDYAMKQATSEDETSSLVWMLPAVKWGYTRILPRTIARIAAKCRTEGSEGEDSVADFQTIAIVRDRPPHHLSDLFTRFEQLQDPTSVARSMEVLWIPNRVAAVLVHAPIKAQSSLPTPLGFLTFDSTLVSRVESFLRARSAAVGSLIH